MSENGNRDRAVLVAGAGGFIGGHLTRELVDAGAEVLAAEELGSRRASTAAER